MAKSWESIGEDRWKLTVSPDRGGAASVFYGTKDEILEKLVDSQANASGRIAELRNSNGTSHAPLPAPTQPRPLTASERMETVADLNNPATVDRGVTRVVESVIGPIDQLRADREAERAERIERAAREAAESFMDMTPEWLSSDHNNSTLVNYMRNMGMDPTNVESYQQAFRNLAEAKLLQPKPAGGPVNDAPPEPELHERNAPTLPPKAPARYSTGVRSSDISGTAPVPTVRLKYTREQIVNMSAATYKSLMSDPDFQRAVEFYSQPAQRKRIPASA